MKSRFIRYIIKIVFIRENVITMKISKVILKMVLVFKFLIKVKFILECIKMINDVVKEMLFFGMVQFYEEILWIIN